MRLFSNKINQLFKTTLIVCGTFAATTTAQAQLVINELMQSNIDCIMDDLNDFPDSWVELYNSGTTPVSLGKYKLGLTTDAASAWQLPTMKIEPGAFVVVYCDKVPTTIHSLFFRPPHEPEIHQDGD